MLSLPNYVKNIFFHSLPSKKLNFTWWTLVPSLSQLCLENGQLFRELKQVDVILSRVISLPARKSNIEQQKLGTYQVCRWNRTEISQISDAKLWIPKTKKCRCFGHSWCWMLIVFRHHTIQHYKHLLETNMEQVL